MRGKTYAKGYLDPEGQFNVIWYHNAIGVYPIVHSLLEVDDCLVSVGPKLIQGLIVIHSPLRKR